MSGLKYHSYGPYSCTAAKKLNLHSNFVEYREVFKIWPIIFHFLKRKTKKNYLNLQCGADPANQTSLF